MEVHLWFHAVALGQVDPAVDVALHDAEPLARVVVGGIGDEPVARPHHQNPVVLPDLTDLPVSRGGVSDQLILSAEHRETGPEVLVHAVPRDRVLVALHDDPDEAVGGLVVPDVVARPERPHSPLLAGAGPVAGDRVAGADDRDSSEGPKGRAADDPGAVAHQNDAIDEELDRAVPDVHPVPLGEDAAEPEIELVLSAPDLVPLTIKRDGVGADDEGGLALEAAADACHHRIRRPQARVRDHGIEARAGDPAPERPSAVAAVGGLSRADYAERRQHCATESQQDVLPSTRHHHGRPPMRRGVEPCRFSSISAGSTRDEDAKEPRIVRDTTAYRLSAGGTAGRRGPPPTRGKPLTVRGTFLGPGTRAPAVDDIFVTWLSKGPPRRRQPVHYGTGSARRRGRTESFVVGSLLFSMKSSVLKRGWQRHTRRRRGRGILATRP